MLRHILLWLGRLGDGRKWTAGESGRRIAAVRGSGTCVGRKLALCAPPPSRYHERIPRTEVRIVMKDARQHTPSGMKSTLLFTPCVLGLLFVGRGAEETSGAVVHIGHETVAAAFAKGGPLLTTNQFKIQAGRREAAGEVEMHERDTDIFHILEGTATLVTGGSMLGTRTVSSGEVRAKEIVGGEERKLEKGDVIVIPTHVPHWFKEVRGPFLYFVVKVTQ